MGSKQLPPTFDSNFHTDTDACGRMEYTKLGKTSLTVSKISQGGGPFGDLYGNVDEVAVKGAVSEALKRGINFIDTSFWYGQGKSEERLGVALNGIPRGTYYIGTKIGRYFLEPERMFDFRAETVLRTFDEALRRLQLEYVDILQVHDFEYAPNESILLNETLPALQKIKDSGKCRYIGITGYPLSNFKSIIDQSAVKLDVILTYARASLHDHSLNEYIPFFEANGIGIINAAPIAMRLLTNEKLPEWHAAYPEIKENCRKAAEFCQSKGVDISKLALHDSIATPGVHTTLIGANSKEIVRKNVEAYFSGLNETERECMKTLKEKFFQHNENWEGVEVKRYWDYMEKLKKN